MRARTAGFFWLMTFLFGVVAMKVPGGTGNAANLAATACYAAATLLVYDLLKPVNRNVSLLAALFSLTGCTLAVLNGLFRLGPLTSNVTFLFFGLHCFLVGFLILGSTFLPRIVGALMVFAGLGWLTMSLANLLSPPFGRSLSPYIMLPGMLGEASLTLWLLVFGVNVPRWKEQAARAAKERP